MDCFRVFVFILFFFPHAAFSSLDTAWYLHFNKIGGLPWVVPHPIPPLFVLQIRSRVVSFPCCLTSLLRSCFPFPTSLNFSIYPPHLHFLKIAVNINFSCYWVFSYFSPYKHYYIRWCVPLPRLVTAAYVCERLALFCACPLLCTLCTHLFGLNNSGMWVGSASVQSCEVAAVFYWSLLFQKPDQIEVGEDGFKQWDGKTSPEDCQWLINLIST